MTSRPVSGFQAKSKQCTTTSATPHDPQLNIAISNPSNLTLNSDLGYKSVGRKTRKKSRQRRNMHLSDLALLNRVRIRRTNLNKTTFDVTSQH